MNRVKVLIEGFAKEFPDHEEVSPSVVLVIFDSKMIIIDPGFNKKALIDALLAENLTTDKIDYVILTHNHLDHSMLAGIFENAVVLDNSDKYFLNGTIWQQDESTFEPGVKIIDTPGHDRFHCSVVVDTDDLGKVVVAGDVFWWFDGNEPKKDTDSLLNFEDPYVKDKSALIESRKKILEIADYIIPGHGKMFKNNRT